MKHTITQTQRELTVQRAAPYMPTSRAICVEVKNRRAGDGVSIAVSREDAVELAGVLLLLAGME